jgi:hypothetical protein
LRKGHSQIIWHSLIRDIHVQKLWVNVVIVGVKDVNFVYKIALFEAKNAARIGEIESAVLMIQIP